VHDLTDEAPLAVQFAVAKGTWRPLIVHPPVEVFAWSPDIIELEVQSVQAAPGEQVRVYSAARTAVDLMRLRTRIGEPVAHLALRRYLARRDDESPTCSTSPRPSTSSAPRDRPWRR
jgi:hypothetical protein